MVALVIPIPPHTGVDPLGVHRPYSSVQVSPGEATRHHTTCHFTLLYITVLLQVTQGVHADESPYLRRARLCLWSSHGHAAHSDRLDASGTGSGPWGLTRSGAGLGGRHQLSQSHKPQALHCAVCAAAGRENRAHVPRGERITDVVLNASITIKLKIVHTDVY